MGYPDGWCTDLLGRADALRCLGNAVVPQQAALALALLDDDRGAVQRVPVRVPDEPSRNVEQHVADVVGDLVARTVRTDGDGDGVLGHGAEHDVPADDVKARAS